MQTHATAYNRVRAIFFLHGAAFSSWVPHIPLVQERLGLGHDELGGILLAAAIGVLAVMPIAGRLADRFGSERVVRYSGLFYFIAVGMPAFMPSYLSISIAMFALGFSGAFLDVAMNANGLQVERVKGRSIMSGLHGFWSLGGFVGAGVAAAWFALPVGNEFHLPVVLSLFLIAHVIAQAGLLTDQDATDYLAHEQDGKQSATLPSKDRNLFLMLLPFGVCAFIGQFGEGVLTDWATVFMNSELSSGPTLAAVGFAVYSFAMAATRLSGDALVTRFGRVRVLLTSSVLASLGTLVLTFSPHIVVAWIGCGIAGMGLAVILPLLLSAASQATGKGGGAVVSTIAATGYSAIMAGPPVIGAIGEAVGLVTAFALTSLFLAMIIPVYMLTMRRRLQIAGNG
ncbi:MULTISPECIES: MFS transporter [Thalassospira]|uniref:MFS transporter n=1 Tax=Thalassospira profundimaris TaxID=502049 RepID=A0A367V7R9_9PROT|nr:MULTISPECIES: MFS transporter [Thalassospira]KZB72854.1 MFS transporter [Thalassospira sp. MCCC 1A01148]MBR9900062.1 MFS transporter [Rhodospirillales bacterium]RCK20541.1 MFS transporter [Thalassospira profundimaris]